MKVAIISQPWDTLQPPVSSGSIPIWTYETAKRLSSRCDVVVYARRSEGQLATEVCESIEYRRVAVAGTKLCNGAVKAIARFFPKFRYLSSKLYYLPYPFRVAIDLKKQACDVVHIHNFSQFVPAIRALNPSIKIVLHMHCEWLSQFDRQAIAARLSQVDLIIGCSDYITGKIKACFPEFAGQCRCVYNGVDIDQFAASELATRDLATHDLNVLFVGRLSPEKGIHTLIKAFETVSEAFPAAKLFLIGPNKPTPAEFIASLSNEPMVQNLAQLDPPNYLKNLQDQLPDSLKEKVFFTGQISHLALHQHFQTAAVLVNPSLSEAFGMSLVEAMATGVPVVATRVGGMVDIVKEGTGLLVPPNDVEALAIALKTLLADKALRSRLGKAARKRAVNTFAWKAIATHLFGLYHDLLANRGNTGGL